MGQDKLAEQSRTATELMAAGRFAEAIPLYRALVRAVPGNAGLIMNLGLALHMAGQHREAVAQFHKVLKLDPGHAPAQLFLGAAHLRLGESTEAISPLRRAVRAMPAHVDARSMLADALLSVERFDAAADQFRILSERQPDKPRAWYGLGRSYEALAQRAFEEIEKTAPSSAWWFALVAESRVGQGQLRSAFYFYRRALTEKPDLRGLHAAIAGLYRKTGHPEWAALEEEKEVQAECGPAAGKKTIALALECHFLAGRYSELVNTARRTRSGVAPSPHTNFWLARAYNLLASQSFEKLAQLPPSAELHEFLAGLHRNQRRHAEAAKQWQEALNFSAGDFRLEKELALSLYDSGDFKAAQKLLVKLVEHEPDSADVNWLLGDTLLNLQQPEESIRYLVKAVQRDSSVLPAHRSLGYAYMQTGLARDALPHLETALRMDEDGSIHYQLARAYQATGQQEQARKALRKYEEMRQSAQATERLLEQEAEITPP